ncbi:hypothetical protein [Cesiribacter sp. SM1]|uniref:hypothetical protein n=1 Tax=Cesiribacter sp. SM1 TaxID=2861196 RepID=UPI001CD7430A|nr:hypothetical protein [Cesiribacter sp. SM1]
MAVLAGSCNRESAADDDADTIVITTPGQDTTVADTLTRHADDGVAVETPADEPVPEVVEEEQAKQPNAQPAREKQKQPSTAERTPASGNTQAGAPAVGTPAPPSDGGVLQEGSYRLQSVQGEGLPLVLDMTTDCDTKLMSGTLQLQNGRFQFRSTAAEVCGGQTRKQEEHAAAGSYRLDGNRIFLKVESGEVLGDAAGVVEGNAIRLQQISNDEEQQEVDWLFEM